MVVAIIPARGGSKRVPRKNIRPFRGRPIIAYSINAARTSDLFDRIVVSTDDEEVAEVEAAGYGGGREEVSEDEVAEAESLPPNPEAL